MSAAATLQDARRRARISQAALARRAGISQATISRIESGAVDPGWDLMAQLLAATGHSIDLTRNDAADLISAEDVSREIRGDLLGADEPGAVRSITEAAGRIVRYQEKSGGSTPAWVFQPAVPTGAEHWDAVVAAVYGWLGHSAGQTVQWADDAKPLAREYVVGDPSAPEKTRERIRQQTPEYLRHKRVLVRARDLTIA